MLAAGEQYASAPYEVTVKDGYYALLRRVVPTTLPPVWAKPTGLEGNPNAALYGLAAKPNS